MIGFPIRNASLRRSSRGWPVCSNSSGILLLQGTLVHVGPEPAWPERSLFAITTNSNTEASVLHGRHYEI